MVPSVKTDISEILMEGCSSLHKKRILHLVLKHQNCF